MTIRAALRLGSGRLSSTFARWPGALILFLAHNCAFAQAQPGQGIYEESCAVCHDGGIDRAPARSALEQLPAEVILAALERGSMVTMAVTLSPDDRVSVAEYVAGEAMGEPIAFEPPASAMCRNAAPFDASDAVWQGWGGAQADNARFQTAENAGLSAEDVGDLEVKWAFGFPGDIRAYAPPTIVGGRLFLGSQGGTVYSLDADTGCVHWYLDVGASVRSAMTVAAIENDGADRVAVFFGDGAGIAQAVDAVTGESIWQTELDEFPVASVSGSPAYHDGRVYFGVASGEEGASASPDYECCRFRGSVVALDADTGQQVWKSYTVEAPTRRDRNAVGTQLWGPSGAPIWASPVVDPVANAIYATTGNNYSNPPSDMSDAFVAFDLDTGQLLWSQQMTEGDAWTAACRLFDTTNCADLDAPDYDFGASAMLVTLDDGSRLLIAGQKSGVVHALDPDRDGAIVWQTRVGQGGSMGGVQWGTATDGEYVYVAVSDVRRIAVEHAWATEADPEFGGGMYALDVETGETVWYVPPFACTGRPRCSPAQPGAVTAMEGVAFSGSMDGHFRAYSKEDGSILLDFDTIRSFETVNGVAASGGAIDGAGTTIGNGTVFVNSGYPHGGGMPGNVLIALTVNGE